MGFIRRTVAGLVAAEVAAGIRILYGGSMTADNAAEFLAEPEIDGGLVGGASLNPEVFARIARLAAAASAPGHL